MKKINELYNEWVNCVEDNALLTELKQMNDAQKEDAFFKELSFGTGGLRGVIGAGTNRMNYYTVARATKGLASYIKDADKKNPSVAIGYDSRIMSEEFAKHCAKIMASKGIKVYIYKTLMPTPLLSYAVRQQKTTCGIMITASHNPSKYNGYKVYGNDGCQITDDAAKEISDKISLFDYFDSIDMKSFEEYLDDGTISYIPDEVEERFIQKVLSQSVLGENTQIDKDIAIVYSPLNGTGRVPVLKTLKYAGFNNVTVVSEQEMPDGNFTTCPYPNPEIPEAMSLGIEYCKKHNADVFLATDPDCDRVGVVCKNENDEYIILTGNEVGILLLEYIIKLRKNNNNMPCDAVVVKTIVTTDLAEKIAKSYGINIVSLLTGFKYIGEYIGMLEEKNQSERYIFGFEESCGYLTSDYVRDKDGVVAAYMICEMVAYYKKLGVSLYEALMNIYKTYGFTKNTLKSYEFEGPCGLSNMQKIMQQFRNEMSDISGLKVLEVLDYQRGIDNLPKSDVIKFMLENDCSVVVRPSGTEPKLKIYISASASSDCEAQLITEKIIAFMEDKLKI